MKRIITLVVVLLVACGSLLARRVPAEKALGYARNWWLQKDGPRKAVLEPVATEFQNIYLFVDTAGRGFVMLAADDRSLPVLGYSLSNGFVADSTMPAVVHDWVQDYDDQIQFLIDNNIEKTAEINAQWQDLNNERSQLPAAWSTQVDPLIQSIWGQEFPFNKFCPSNLTGCVATAMAMIMRYYSFPEHGIGSNTYTPDGFSTPITVSFEDSTFDWSQMLNYYTYDYNQSKPYPPLWDTIQSNAVARLMKCVGVAVNMKYAPVGSGKASNANTVAANFDEPAAVNAYKKYFKYKWTATSVHIEDYTTLQWKNLLKNELDHGRPVQYSGSSAGSGGHSWVCDGYDKDEKFHMNWGSRYGYYSGFYAIGSLNRGGYAYNLCNKAVIGIEPDSTIGSTITVSASTNKPAWGTVNGLTTYSHSYTKYQDTVTITPSANIGYRFVGWSDNNNNIVSREVPLKFLANGDGVSFTANFEPIYGDTLYYCNGGSSKYYGTLGSDFYGAIRIPSNCLDVNDTLTNVMFYSTFVYGSHYIDVKIYQGQLTSTSVPVQSFTYKPTKEDAWESVALQTPLAIDASQDLYIAIKSKYSLAASMPAATSYGAYYTTNPNYGWSTFTSGGAPVTWMIKAVMSSSAVHKLTIDKNAVDLTTVSQNIDLRAKQLAVSNKGATVTFDTVSCYPPGCVTISNGYLLTATKYGNVKLKAHATFNSKYTEEYVDLQIERGTLTYDWTWRDWFSPTSWGPNKDVIPDSVNYNVLIDASCDLTKAAQCHNLTIGQYGKLYVDTGAVLRVSGELINADASRLVIEEDENGGGTLIFGSGTPQATVEVYLKGTIGSDGKDPDWQLRGCIVNDFQRVDGYYNEWKDIHVYEWDESLNASGCWKNKMVGSQVALDPWKGYGFANYTTSPKTITYTGTLINSDKTWTLSRTGSGNANVGNNMLTNSYAAPIEIRKLQFNNAKASVIFYNTGSLVEWQQFNGDTTNWTQTAPGQMLVCPAYTAAVSGMPTAIPSGQSFYVVANQDGATVSVKYSDVMKTTSGPMYAPAEEEQFNVLGVRIASENGGDRAVLIECESCSDDYDDGYDGMKYFGNAALPQLYVLNDFGNTSINAAESIVGKRLGVHVSDKGKPLTMTFETDKLSGYSQLKLKDLKTGRYADILSDQEYHFSTTGDDDARFEVVGFADDEQTPDEELTVAGNTLYVGKFAGRVSMYDMSGKAVWQADVRENEWFELPELLHGVYLMKSDNATIKIVK